MKNAKLVGTLGSSKYHVGSKDSIEDTRMFFLAARMSFNLLAQLVLGACPCFNPRTMKRQYILSASYFWTVGRVVQ